MSSTTNNTTNNNDNEYDFPFQAVVVTFPDEGAAQVAAHGPLQELQEWYRDTQFLATCDPFGCRCGSGGGTLAALAEVGSRMDMADTGGSVLILHAGGDSSRCFTQMALGKAWTNLPVQDQHGDVLLSNPIRLGMDSIARIFSESHTLPRGSIVIAASDALLSIPHWLNPDDIDDAIELGSSQHDDDPMPDVLGVAFPAPLETAKNHGVYVLADPPLEDNEPTQQDLRELEVPIQKVLQKPSMETLQQQPFVTFGNVQNTQGLAWIDNGIIAFLPRAAKALHELANGILKTTTKQGLLEEYQNRQPTEPTLTYQDVTYKVDLYTHFLQALTIAAQPELSLDQHRHEYMTNHANDLPLPIAQGIFDALSPFQFQSLAVPEGKFLHLGTTRELLDFYVHGCQKPKPPPPPQQQATTNTRHELYTQNCAYFGQELGMIPRMQVFVQWHIHNHNHNNNPQRPRIGKDCVLMASVLEADGNDSYIGEGTVLEFCSLQNKTQAIRIGSNCLVSGLRSLPDSSTTGAFQLPNDTSMQMMPLVSFQGNITAFVVMALGVNDPIKKPIADSTLFGIPMQTFLQWANLTPQDLWDDDDEPTIWNAQLHPVLASKEESIMDVWDWINHLPTESSNNNNHSAPPPPSLEHWIQQPRLSLKQVRDQSNAAAEFGFRHFLLHTIVPERQTRHCQDVCYSLTERRHDECNLDCLHDPLQALQTLDRVIAQALLDTQQYDVCGRALMVQSALLDDWGSSLQDDDHEDSLMMDSMGATNLFWRAGDLDHKITINDKCSRHIQAIQSRTSSGADRQRAYQEIALLRDEYIQTANHHRSSSTTGLPEVWNAFSEIMEKIAQIMTEICVSGFLQDNNHALPKSSKLEPVLDQWVIATSPARVDLAGGWSDTPPICYEYGSRVTGMAVTVDRKKPLSCRCRIVSCDDSSSEKGIVFVRSELRDSQTCELTSSLDLTLESLEDLRDARNPRANGALIKCALVCLGLVTLEMLQQERPDTTLQACVDQFCKSPNGKHVRMEIVVTSLLPQGSGMGTSSILGGCVLAAVGRCVGIDLDGGTDIIDSVSVLEQILSTGGGFQDQVNGLIGGVKTVSSQAGQLPIQLAIDPATIDPAFQKKLDDHLLLAFTGKTRLAKNILQNVLRRFARRTPEVVACMQGLVEGAQKAREAMIRGDLETLGQCLQTYYEQKKHMAGEESGVEPEVVRLLLEDLIREKLILGGSLCGAGGGGFLVMIAAPGSDKAKIHAVVEECLNRCDDEAHSAYSWHDCHLSKEGLTTRILSEGGSVDDFEASWHS